MEYQIAYLNTYGNAGILADELMNILDGAVLIDLSAQEITDDADVYLLVFEITQNAIPLEIMDVLELLEGKTILCVAASGTESEERAEKCLRPFLPDECDYRGLFLCQGQVSANVFETVLDALAIDPENEQAKIMLESCQRSANHPDADDLRDLRRFIRESDI